MKIVNKKLKNLTSIVLTVVIIAMLTVSMSLPVSAAPVVYEVDLASIDIGGGFNVGSDADGA